MLLERQADDGFWLPNDLIDRHAKELGPLRLFIYCVLARSATLGDYPAADELARLAGITVGRIGDILSDLFDRGLLNYADLLAVRPPCITFLDDLTDDEEQLSVDSGQLSALTTNN